MSHQMTDRAVMERGLKRAGVIQQLERMKREAGKRRVAAAIERAKVLPLTDRQVEAARARKGRDQLPSPPPTMPARKTTSTRPSHGPRRRCCVISLSMACPCGSRLRAIT